MLLRRDAALKIKWLNCHVAKITNKSRSVVKNLELQEEGPCEVEMDRFCKGFGSYQADPFMEEVYGKEVKMFICESCYTGLFYEI